MRSIHETRRELREAQRFYGKYAAIVIDNVKLEGNGDHYGDVKVRVPGILQEAEDGSGDVPIEVYARPCFHPGFFFIPEIEARVWVEFVAGDINEPIWTGVWYPAKPDEEIAGVPATADGEPPDELLKVIRTVSGNVVTLDDTEDAERLVMRIDNEEDSCTLSLDTEGIVIESTGGRTIELRDGSDNVVAMSDGGITLSALGRKSVISLEDGKITLDVSGTLIEVSDGAIKLKAASVDAES